MHVAAALLATGDGRFTATLHVLLYAAGAENVHLCETFLNHRGRIRNPVPYGTRIRNDFVWYIVLHVASNVLKILNILFLIQRRNPLLGDGYMMVIGL
ncbi:MAG: hypothetical protein CMI60_07050 [Parvibaculum sp.]|nr:hypothetical protein [Parvibaculum sp.]